MKFAGWFSMTVGALMLAQWSFFLAAGQVPELQTTPIALSFHLVAEAVTALALLVAGYGVLRGVSWAKTADFIALGMLTYTLIVSPGYFAQQGSWPLVLMFLLLLVLAVFAMIVLARAQTAPVSKGSLPNRKESPSG